LASPAFWLLILSRIEIGFDMKTLGNTRIFRRTGVASRAVALVSLLGLLVGTFGAIAQRGVGAQSMSAAAQKTHPARLTDEQRILHVLNRLGYGARPGDVERVKTMGIDNYIKQQLHPESISDPVAEAKIKDRNLSTLSMTQAELYEKFPQPGQLVRELQRRGELPADLDPQKLQAANAGAGQQGGPPRPGETVSGAPAADASDPEAKKNAEYRDKIREYYTKNGLQQPQRITAELQASRILRAVYSERQLQEVMVDFWTNHFNVFMAKGADRWLLTAYDRDTIRPNTMGNFYDLLLATAKSPAMLFYLDNFQSVSPNARPNARPGNQNPNGPNGNARGAQAGGGPLAQLMRGRVGNNRPGDVAYPQQGQNPQGAPNAQRPPQSQQPPPRRGINENYARELMELHTLGVDGGYSQKDVQEVARCFTGWTIFAPRGAAGAPNAMMGSPRAEALRNNAGRFFFNPNVHDNGEKIVLGQKIPAGGGMGDGLAVLNILAHRSSTAKFIATKLARHFVMDNPSPALVERVAAAFTKSNGDIRETLSAIFFSPEFNGAAAYRAKIKRPFELTISAIRTLCGETNGTPALHQWIARMGEPLYGFQTPNGYSDVAESWVNTGALIERLNFGLALASNRIPGTRVDLKKLGGDGIGDKAKIMDRFLQVIVAGDISPRTKETLMKQLNEQLTIGAPPAAMADQEMAMAGPPQGRRQLGPPQGPQAVITDPVTKIVGLILGSPEFQRQ
jgi:uncharacterized protein (DUF1800 family)